MPPDTGTILVVMMIGLTIGLFWLLVYIYGLYSMGRKLARFEVFALHPYRTGIQIALASLILASPAILFIREFIPLFSTILGIWWLHTQAVGVGFWAGLELKQKANTEVFSCRTEEWLREWEEEEELPPIWLRDSLQ